MDKRAVRRECFRRLKSLSESEKAAASESIRDRIATHPDFVAADLVFTYLPLPSEPDLRPLLNRFPEKRWASSRVAQDGRIVFHRLDDLSSLRTSEHGFLEPNPDRCEAVEEPDLILVPGVGFDPERQIRLGRGKGHYDRFLASELLTNPELPRLGICFSPQLLTLEAEAHDIGMTAIVTEG